MKQKVTSGGGSGASALGFVAYRCFKFLSVPHQEFDEASGASGASGTDSVLYKLGVTLVQTLTLAPDAALRPTAFLASFW